MVEMRQAGSVELALGRHHPLNKKKLGIQVRQSPLVALWVAHYLATGMHVKFWRLSMYPGLQTAQDPLFCTLQLLSAEKGEIATVLAGGVILLVFVVLGEVGGGFPNWQPPVESR